MRAQGLVRFFTVALILVCLYQLLFTFVAKRIESRADTHAKELVIGTKAIEEVCIEGDRIQQTNCLDSINREIASIKRRYLDSIGHEKVLDLLFIDYTYQQCKARELSLGLDLQGGMSVVLQVSIEDIIKGMSDNSRNPTFVKALEIAKENPDKSSDDFVTRFGKAFEQQDPGARLAAIFSTPDNRDIIPPNATNQEVLAEISREVSDAIRRTYNIINTRIDQFGVTQPNISLQPGPGRIIVELPGADNPERIRGLLQATAQLEFWETFDNREIIDNIIEANNVLRDIVGTQKKTEEKKEDDLTQFFTDDDEEKTEEKDTVPPDATPSLFGDDGDTAITPEGELMTTDEDFESESPLFAVLTPSIYEEAGTQLPSAGPVVGYALGINKDKVDEYLSMDKIRALFPRNIKFIWSAKPVEETQNTYALFAIKTLPNEEHPPLDGGVIVDARQDFDQNGRPSVDMRMNTEGGRIWKRMTAEAVRDINNKQSIAIVLDNSVYSAPVVQSEISGGRSQITGNFTIEEAQDLANVLKAGKLPAPAKIVEEEIVGPSLGKESVRAGLQSLVLGLAIVLVFMIFYYNTAGVVANVVLALNLFFIIGVLASLGASLTLPGMAGIVLTIGMAVDANVIIFERIREELLKGKGLKLAIADGYKNSYSAIIDANITGLITGFILLYFGLGPVKGFATVLVIGIFSSLLTAVLVSRLIVDEVVSRDKVMKFSNKFTVGAFANLNFDFIGKRKMAYLFSGLFILAGIVSIATRGFELGVDFKGGRSYVVRFDKPVSTPEISLALASEFGTPPIVKTFGGSNQVKVTTAYLIDQDAPEIDSIVDTKLYEGMKQFFTDEPTLAEFNENYKLSSAKVGPSIAEDIKQGAYYATFFAIIGVFLYILARFRKWQFSLGAIVATVHDVLFVLTIFSVFRGILPFSLEMDQALIAALLTIIGYSINDTVVVFDRIREYLALHPHKDMKHTINLAINSTLSRTILTAVTTLFVVGVLFIFGGEVIRGFSFALLVGIAVGTYSSVFIAAPIVIDLAKKESK